MVICSTGFPTITKQEYVRVFLPVFATRQGHSRAGWNEQQRVRVQQQHPPPSCCPSCVRLFVNYCSKMAALIDFLSSLSSEAKVAITVAVATAVLGAKFLLKRDPPKKEIGNYIFMFRLSSCNSHLLLSACIKC